MDSLPSKKFSAISILDRYAMDYISIQQEKWIIRRYENHRGKMKGRIFPRFAPPSLKYISFPISSVFCYNGCHYKFQIRLSFFKGGGLTKWIIF